MNRQTSVGEAPVKLVCETFGVPRSSFYAASKAVRGPATARPVPQRRGVPTAELLEAIEAILRDQPGWGHRKVWAVLRRPRQGAQTLKVGRRRVYELMRANGSGRCRPRRATLSRCGATSPCPSRTAA